METVRSSCSKSYGCIAEWSYETLSRVKDDQFLGSRIFMKVRLRIGRIREVEKIPRIGHIIEASLKRKMIHGCKSKSKA